MSISLFASIVPYTILLSLFLVSPAAAFGAGNIPTGSGLFGFNGRHGDIATLLLTIPITAAAASATTKTLNMQRVYFGNWLRDYSQIMDVTAMQKVPEEVLRAIVSILGFMEFGYATKEFDITRDRLGVYRPEEHIDNPKGYTNSAKADDNRLRGPVQAKELEIDPETGMKNYISNDNLGIDTSSSYIRRELRVAIEQGRQGQHNEDTKYEAFRHLGAALHTLEDFSAHSNYVELCLLLLGKQHPEYDLNDVFPYVGEATAPAQTRAGPAPPVVTGSFGPLDIVESLLGEIDDKMSTGKLSDLSVRLPSGGFRKVVSTIEAVCKLVEMGESTRLVQKGFSDKVRSLQSSIAATNSQVSTWHEVNQNPSGIWDAIEPFFSVRDDFVKWLQQRELNLDIITKTVAEISEGIDKMVFAAIAVVVGPILGDVRQQLEIEKERLLAAEKAAAKDAENDIFASDSTATNPTHSQIAKDHFDCVLNIPAARVAAVATKFATTKVLECWTKPQLDADEVIASILQTLHHPFNIDFNKQDSLQQEMYRAATGWWTDKPAQQRNILRGHLGKSAIAAGKHKFPIENPKEWYNVCTFGAKPAENKSVADIVVDNVKKAIEKSGEEVKETAKRAFKDFADTLNSNPTPATPNPFDDGLKKIPVKIGLTALFEGVSKSAVLAVPTMGNVLKSLFNRR